MQFQEASIYIILPFETIVRIVDASEVFTACMFNYLNNLNPSSLSADDSILFTYLNVQRALYAARIHSILGNWPFVRYYCKDQCLLYRYFIQIRCAFVITKQKPYTIRFLSLAEWKYILLCLTT